MENSNTYELILKEKLNPGKKIPLIKSNIIQLFIKTYQSSI